jgi:formylglycine-generating enzyme required for sulfatase activity
LAGGVFANPGAGAPRADFADDKVGFEMVFVKGGAFTMGCTPEQGKDCRDDESPAHGVTVSDYHIGKYPVTEKQWAAVMGQEWLNAKDPNSPMTYISWDNAQEFIYRLNKMTGRQYRLPTEAEWEYAARGGDRSKGYKYSGTDNSFEARRSHDIKYRNRHNELGLYYMSGYVAEWVNDLYGSYTSEAKTDPVGPLSGSDMRVLRGYTIYSRNSSSEEQSVRVS